jgi:hypothetical protein
MCQFYTISQPRLVAKPDIVESSVSDERMTDISGSIDTLRWFNGKDDRETDRVVDRSTVWLPDPLGSDRRTQSQSIAGLTLEVTQLLARL